MKRYGKKQIIEIMKSNRDIMIRYDNFEDKASVIFFNPNNDIDIQVGYIIYDLFHKLRKENEIDYIIKGYRFSYWGVAYGRL